MSDLLTSISSVLDIMFTWITDVFTFAVSNPLLLLLVSISIIGLILNLTLDFFHKLGGIKKTSTKD